MNARPSDAALWDCMAQTLRDVVLPAIDDAFARRSTIQLIGLATYARERADDCAAAAGSDALTALLDELADNPLVAPEWPGPDAAAAAARALSATVGRHDEAAEQVRATLRALLVAQLDTALAETRSLDGPFRGRLDG